MEKERLGYLKLKKERLLQKYGKEAYISFISIFVLVLFLAGSSFAIFTDLDEGSGHNSVTVGNLSVLFNDTDSGLGGEIVLTDARPVTDTVGKTNEPYKFRITNNGNIKAIIRISLQDDEAAINTCGCTGNLIANDNIKYQIIDETSSITYDPRELLPGGEIFSVTLNAQDSKTFALRVWIKDDANYLNVRDRHFHKKIVIDSSQETPRLLKELVIGNNESNVITSTATTTKAAVGSSFYDGMPTTLANYQTEICNVNGDYYDYGSCQECSSNEPDDILSCESRFNEFTNRSNIYAVENGLYKATGNSGDNTYFFRGNVINNYVALGDSMWKIVRINEDQTIRIMRTTSAFTSTWNSIMDEYKYLGYDYYETGELVNSTIRISLETWYSNNMMPYDKFIAAANYCNDLEETALNSGIPVAIGRRSTGTPTYVCPSEFTYALKVGLLSSDEIIYAGFRNYTNNQDNFLTMRDNYYLMTPHGFVDTSANVQVIKGAHIDEQSGLESASVYPVVNLVPTVKVTGIGTSTDPYIIIEA